MLGFNRSMRVETEDRAIADKICAMVKHLTGDVVEPIKIYIIPHATLPHAFGEVMHGLALNPKVRVDRNIVKTIHRLTVGWMETYHRFFLGFKEDTEHPAAHTLSFNVARYAAGLAQGLAQEPEANETSPPRNGTRARNQRPPRRTL